MSDKLEEKLNRYREVEAKMADPAIAANREAYNALAKEFGALRKIFLRHQSFKELDDRFRQAESLVNDPDMGEMAREEVEELRPKRKDAYDELTDLLISEPEDDHASLIMEIRAGTGGEEASLFARDLSEMYKRYAEQRGWKVEILDFHVSEHRGFKEVSLSIAGEDAFRDLRFESGGHRVQRVPETEAQGRIHTSAATVAVLAEPEEVEIDIRPEDIVMEATRSSGPGGQHVNKTSSAVRLTHLPSGLVVFCQEERSQFKNRSKAMRMLRAQLYDQMQRQKKKERDETRRSQVGSGDRNERIRTYNFPQNRCTDHRINQSFNLEPIIAGDLRKLTKALADHDRAQRIGGDVVEL